jgi:hypothetical protein
MSDDNEMRDALEDASCFQDCDRHVDLASWDCNHFEIWLGLRLWDRRLDLRNGSLNCEKLTQLTPMMQSYLTPETDGILTSVIVDLATDNLRALPVRVTKTLSTPLVGLGTGIIPSHELPQVRPSRRPTWREADSVLLTRGPSRELILTLIISEDFDRTRDSFRIFESARDVWFIELSHDVLLWGGLG